VASSDRFRGCLPRKSASGSSRASQRLCPPTGQHRPSAPDRLAPIRHLHRGVRAPQIRILQIANATSFTSPAIRPIERNPRAPQGSSRCDAAPLTNSSPVRSRFAKFDADRDRALTPDPRRLHPKFVWFHNPAIRGADACDENPPPPRTVRRGRDSHLRFRSQCLIFFDRSISTFQAQFERFPPTLFGRSGILAHFTSRLAHRASQGIPNSFAIRSTVRIPLYARAFCWLRLSSPTALWKSPALKYSAQSTGADWSQQADDSNKPRIAVRNHSRTKEGEWENPDSNGCQKTVPGSFR